ncbi:hypothetical protein [Bacillus infantis]|uniref:hypothetical protein n=1 Tax=Bacillus infantis TaxID=324767 RepID=UPI003CEE5C71
MKFKLHTSSGKIDKYMKTLSKYGYRDSEEGVYNGEIDIQTLDELLQLQKDLDIEVIISHNDYDDGETTLEIYDSYRE